MVNCAMNKLDRYILRSFASTFVFAVLALCTIFLVVNILESLDKFLDLNVQVLIILKYYFYFFPEILKLLTPVAMLIASLFSIGRLTNLNEITAMKSGGMSLYRMMIPIVVLSAFICAGQLYFNGWIVPRALTKKLSIERQYLGKGSGSNQTQVYNLYYRETPTTNVVLSYYDAISKTGNDIIVEYYESEMHPVVKRRLDAKTLQWDSVQNVWMISNGFERTFVNGKFEVRRIYKDSLQLSINHHSITELQRAPEEMNFDELREYISILERGGKDVRQKVIDYYGQYAFPFANFIVVMFGVPFASVKKKSGIAVEIATAMIVSFVYLVFTKVSQSIGMEINTHPAVIGWAANGIFFIIGVLNLLRTKT